MGVEKQKRPPYDENVREKAESELKMCEGQIFYNNKIEDGKKRIQCWEIMGAQIRGRFCFSTPI